MLDVWIRRAYWGCFGRSDDRPPVSHGRHANLLTRLALAPSWWFIYGAVPPLSPPDLIVDLLQRR